ncbi:TetR/AcrR family transcriptional regulator [Actinocorallia populi]|uniref:TetR/AcrR family transcriptional regulator n=1 Tax=Actinocorallia populi TaxID=2079200 RepID=UPI000D092C95|nr:TetR/AcrR family transcriptional regulator [Actinocorallia populi]
MSSLSERGTRTRRRLLDAAAEELIRTGEVEVAAVARRAGVSVGLPYRYFGTQSGLVSALLARFYYGVDAQVFRSFPGTTWAEREQARMAALVRHLYADAMAPVILGQLSRDVQAAEVEARYMRLVIDRAARNLAGARSRGEAACGGDLELLAANLMGGLRSAIGLALNRTPRPDPAALTDHLWGFMRDITHPVRVRRGPAHPGAADSS